MRLALFILIALIGFCGHPQQALARQESYPYLAQVTEDNINVRAGVSTNFENLCRLQKGDEVVVVGRNYSWLKIRLPLIASSYISKKYVRLLENNSGEITADKVNVRAGANINRTVLYQLKAGDQIRIIDEAEDFYKIEPSHADAVGWVHENLLAFKSKDTTAYLSEIYLARNISNPPTTNDEPSPSVKVYGALGKNENSDFGKSVYVLTVSRSEDAAVGTPDNLPEGAEAVYITNLETLPQYFLHQRVVIDGHIDAAHADTKSSAMSISKIHLVL